MPEVHIQSASDPATCGYVAGMIASADSHIIVGDARSVLPHVPDNCVRCCVTSPPYWSLRDYEIPGQIGLEACLDEYIANLVAVFEDVRRVLAADGTLWLNIGDSYTSGGRTWRCRTRRTQSEQ